MEVADGQGAGTVHRGGRKTADVTPERIPRLQVQTKEKTKVRRRTSRDDTSHRHQQDKTGKGRER